VLLTVERIPATASYPLRHAVLRPHQDLDSVAWSGDDEPATATFGAIEETTGAVVGVATVFPEPAPFDPAVAGFSSSCPKLESATWRLRGMATSPGLQGRGIGMMVIGAVIGHVADQGGRLLWCNARVSAIGFYERAGFTCFGQPWELPTIGPHVVMWRRVETPMAT
jgi:GNAT superfamily N-acetyltransferase